MKRYIQCTGDVVAGDYIKFTEAVFGGSHRRPQYLGDRTIYAEVKADSYGADKQQHTFTLRVSRAYGLDAASVRQKVIKRKGRNIYRHGTKRLVWSDEAARKVALVEKHARGDAARQAALERRANAWRREP